MDDFNTYIDCMFSKMKGSNGNMLLAGDFNIDLLKIKAHSSTHALFKLMTSYQLSEKGWLCMVEVGANGT